MNTAMKRNNVTVIGAGEKTLLFVHGYGTHRAHRDRVCGILPSQR
jgi:hypothetical protein